MKTILSSIIYLNTLIIAYSQQGTIDLTQIKVQNIPFNTSPYNLTKNLGPHKLEIVDSDENCGFFDSNDKLEFVRYIYPSFTFIGKSTTGFQLEKVDFTENQVEMTYQSEHLSNQTTLKEFCKIFKVKVSIADSIKPNETLLLLSETRDDGARFHFKNGKLSGFEYYFPC